MVRGALVRLCVSLTVFTALAAPCFADGVLEQMQNELASVVASSKKAIVSIEDDRAAIAAAWRNSQTSPPAVVSDPAGARLLSLLVEQADVDEDIALFEAQGKQEQSRLGQLRQSSSNLQQQVNAFEDQVQRSPGASNLQQSIDANVLAHLMIKRQDFDTKLNQLKSRSSLSGSARVQINGLEQASETVERQITAVNRQIEAQRRSEIPKSGSGFSVGNGYVVTTADVLDGMKSPIVIADDGTHIRAKVVAVDSDMNIGLLLLPAKANLPALQMGDSDTVAVGHFAISIGNQTGHLNSVSLTLVSGIRTNATFSGGHFYPGLIQIAGTVGAGTSGAPILNSSGSVIGIIAAVPVGEWTQGSMYMNPGGGDPLGPGGGPPWNGSRHSERERGGRGADVSRPEPPRFAINQAGTTSVRLVQSGSPHEGDTPPPPIFNSPPNGAVMQYFRPPVTSAGFAIPINAVRPVLDDMIAGRKIVPTWIGVDLFTDRKFTEQDDIIHMVRLAKVREVYADSPASRAGLQSGDVIQTANGKVVQDIADIHALSIRMHPDDVLNFEVDRGGKTMVVSVKLEARPANAGRRRQ